MKPKPIDFGVLLYEEAQSSAVYGLTDLFLFCKKVITTNTAYAGKTLKITHWQWNTKNKTLQKTYDTSPESPTIPEVIIIPPSLGEPLSSHVASHYVPWLTGLYQQGCLLASVCAGAFLLGETGLLDGRHVTTHWIYAEAFASRFPNAILDINELIIDNDDLITAGGALAWTDLGLKLIERFLGTALMLDTARMLLINPPRRQQRPYISFTPKEHHNDKQILTVQHWLGKNYTNGIKQASLAALAGLEARTFLRRFKKATGNTPTEYHQRLRISHGRYLLETTKYSVETIAWQVGYADSTAFRRLFYRYIGLTPGEYRHKFGL